MVKKGLLVRLEAKAGKEAEAESFLSGALPWQKTNLRLPRGLRFV